MKKNFLLAALSLFGIGIAQADETTPVAKASVGQGGAVLEAAQFDISQSLTFQFDASGKLVMTLGEGTAHVAELPVCNGATMTVECGNFNASANVKSATVSASGYATLYSAFQLQVPTEGAVEVYAPVYEDGKLKCNNSTKIEAGDVIPAGTGLLLVNEGSISLPYSAATVTAIQGSALSGSAIAIAKPVVEGKTVYTLGHNSASGHESEYGFFTYGGTQMAAGKAYLLTETIYSAGYVRISFDEDEENTTSISDLKEPAVCTDGKRFEDGRLVIYRDGKKYSSTGTLIK